MSDTTENSASPSYKGRGLILSQQDYEFLTGCLTEKIAKIQQDQPEHLDKVGPMKRLMVRLSHIVMDAQGMLPAVAERYARRIQGAMLKQDPEAMADAVAALLAAVIRLDPDPAQHIGEMLVAQLGQATGVVSQQMFLQWMSNLQTVLSDAQKEWSTSQYPSGAETLDWVIAAISAGVEDVQSGHEPWAALAADESSAADPAPSAEISPDAPST